MDLEAEILYYKFLITLLEAPPCCKGIHLKNNLELKQQIDLFILDFSYRYRN